MRVCTAQLDVSCLGLAALATHALSCSATASLLTLVVLVHAGYMVDKLGVPGAEVHELSRELYHGYGTTMCGLLTHGYQLDVDDWHAAVHDSLEYDKLLHEQPTTRQVRCRTATVAGCLTQACSERPAPCCYSTLHCLAGQPAVAGSVSASLLKTRIALAILQVLARCNLQKHLLTNADYRHAVKCLKRLGISDCFQVRRQCCAHVLSELCCLCGFTSGQCIRCKSRRCIHAMLGACVFMLLLPDIGLKMLSVCAVLTCLCLQDVFCYENVQELGQQAGIITAERPVLCKPSKHVSGQTSSSLMSSCRLLELLWRLLQLLSEGGFWPDALPAPTVACDQLWLQLRASVHPRMCSVHVLCADTRPRQVSLRS